MIQWLYTTRLLLNKPQTDLFNQPLTILFWITQPPNCVGQTAYCVFYNKEGRMCSWSQTQQSLDGINIDRTQCRRICKSLSDKDYCQDLAGLAQQALRGRDDPLISSTLNYVTNITWLFWIISNHRCPYRL